MTNKEFLRWLEDKINADGDEAWDSIPAHAVANSNSLSIQFPDGQEFLLGVEKTSDKE